MIDNQYFLAIRASRASAWRVLVFSSANDRESYADDYEAVHRAGQTRIAGRNDMARYLDITRHVGHLSVMEFAPFAMQFTNIAPIGEVGICCCAGSCDRVFRDNKNKETGK